MIDGTDGGPDMALESFPDGDLGDWRMARWTGRSAWSSRTSSWCAWSTSKAMPPSRCNPVTAPGECAASDIEAPALLVP